MNNKKIVFLDAKSVGDDINLEKFKDFGDLVLYDFSSPGEIPDRVKDADIIITNKCKMDRATLGEAKKLKLICVTATGTNNLDKDFLDSKNIAWRNVAGYSTETVAQHTFAMLFYLLERLSYYDAYVKDEKYVNDTLFTHFANHFHQLCDMKWGVIGLGAIGERVYNIAKTFGCDMCYYSTSGRNSKEGYNRVEFDELLKTCDIVSVHAPLNEATEGLMNADAFKKMKKNAIFINVGRGPIVDEKALYDALVNNEIYGAGLDVLSVEPMREDNPLVKFKDSTRLIITPHIAWASVEARINLMNIIYDQIKEYISADE
ncbi:MAG: D-2-hydroxyacid dehydrogenase [Lachnospiraceae bacterium]|nr:D-2-hydroxyacid dehydrogenase [Lachnospiraceae bacterium]